MEAPGPKATVSVAAALLGFLAVLAATQPPRASRELRRLELVDLIRSEDGRVRDLRGQVVSLRAEIARTEDAAGVSGGDISVLREESRALALRAGAAPLKGPGIVVTLDDSSAARSPTGDPNDLIVHERDIQTVVNALWGAGAEAVAVDGERLAATSAVRCAGNTLLLHGTLHSPPYEIAAIGDSTTLSERLPREAGMERLLAAVQAFGLGYDVTGTEVSMEPRPAGAGLSAAEPARAL